jgi:hypothetical protein
MPSASHITIMRELSSAGDRERTGAFDVEWDGARASLFFIFGHANHVELERSDGQKLVGNEALTAIVEELPDDFRVTPWRRAMVTDDTLRCTAEELMFMFRRDPAKSAGRSGPKPSADESASLAFGQDADKGPGRRAPDGSSDEGASLAFAAPAAGAEEAAVSDAQVTPGDSVPFGLDDFPPLPHGTALFSDSAENVDGLDAAVSHLPDSLIVLTGTSARGAVVIGGRAVIDAVWVDQHTRLAGADAAAAVFASTSGTITAYRVDDPRLVTAISSIWRSPRAHADVAAESVDATALIDGMRADDLSGAFLVTGSADPGVAIFVDGELIAVASSTQTVTTTEPAALAALLQGANARVTLLGTAGDRDVEVGGTAFTLIASPSPPADVADVADLTEVADGGVDTAVTDVAVIEVVDGVDVADIDVVDVEDVDIVEVVDVDPDVVDVVEVDVIEVGDTAAAEVDVPVDTEAAELDAPTDTTAELADANDLAAEGLDTSDLGDTGVHAPAERETAVFTLPDLDAEGAADVADAGEPASASGDEALAAPPTDTGLTSTATEFVPARVDVDIDALRAELIGIADVWLGEADAVPVAEAIRSARPGVDDFVAAIQAISSMDIPGHEHAVVRAMAREMHFRAAEVLCGV